MQSIKDYPYISVVERRSLLGWDERRYSKVVDRLVHRGIIEKVRVSLGKGGQRVLYQLKGMVPSIKHEYYVHWIIEQLAVRGFVCTADKVGPDIQIPSINTAINIELGSSNIQGNIQKALQEFETVIVCSDSKELIKRISEENTAQNIRCALVQDVPALFDSMRTNAQELNR